MLASRNAAIDLRCGSSASVCRSSVRPDAQRVAHRQLRRIIRRQQEHRRHEDDEPDRGQRTGDAIALMRHGIETEQRHESEQRAPGVRVGGEEAEHEDQADDAADIAGGPAGAGQSPDLVRRHQRRHHRIVEDGGEFDADGRDPVGDQQRQNHAGVAGLAEPHQRGADHQQRAERGDPRLAAAAGVRDRAQHRRQQRDHQPRRRGGKAPHRLPAGGIGGHMGGEIGREHEGGDQREVRLRGPVEEDPADDARRGADRSCIPAMRGIRGNNCHARNLLPNHEEAFCPLRRNSYSIRGSNEPASFR